MVAVEINPDPFLLPFSFPIRVYWEDTDAGGVVYHGSYVRFLDRARCEWLRAVGVEQQELKQKEDVVLAVREMRMDFLKPARLDDVLHVSVELRERRTASFVVVQELFRGPECLLKAEVRLACLTASVFRPRPLPPWLLPDHRNGENA
jgi:acyl-CoA thioester hydrolase